MFELFAEPQTWLYLDSTPPPNVEALAARHRRLESRKSPDGTELWLNWGVMYRGELIGFVQATVPAEDRIAIAYFIGKAYWAQGLGTDAVRTMVAFLDARFPDVDLMASVDERNTASFKLLSRLGLAVYDRSDRRNLQLHRTR
jgi:[ribosomal protein S5]-alanine N-acetyltransferase